MTDSDRNVDDDSYDEVEEHLREQDPDEEDRAYFPLEESQPPHYWSDMKTHALFLLLFLVLAAPKNVPMPFIGIYTKRLSMS